jgi:hypothetical protein
MGWSGGKGKVKSQNTGYCARGKRPPSPPFYYIRVVVRSLKGAWGRQGLAGSLGQGDAMGSGQEARGGGVGVGWGP